MSYRSLRSIEGRGARWARSWGSTLSRHGWACYSLDRGSRHPAEHGVAKDCREGGTHGAVCPGAAELLLPAVVDGGVGVDGALLVDEVDARWMGECGGHGGRMGGVDGGFKQLCGA